MGGEKLHRRYSKDWAYLCGSKWKGYGEIYAKYIKYIKHIKYMLMWGGVCFCSSFFFRMRGRNKSVKIN